MTDNELTAEQLSRNTFLRALRLQQPRTEQIDQAFLAEIREITTIGTLTLNSSVCAETRSVRGNVKRIHLERAVVQLPATEKMIFLLHDVEGYDARKNCPSAGLECAGITVWSSSGTFANAGIDFAHVVAQFVSPLSPSPPLALARGFFKILQMWITSLLTLGYLVMLISAERETFSHSYVYPNNNIRSTPTWASPLYRRPLSLLGDISQASPSLRNHSSRRGPGAFLHPVGPKPMSHP